MLEGSELLRISMMVQEANSISRALKRNIVCSIQYSNICTCVCMCVCACMCSMYVPVKRVCVYTYV